jgi:HPt (histidine-containing phosphotransfer) domain-containing protein
MGHERAQGVSVLLAEVGGVRCLVELDAGCLEHFDNTERCDALDAATAEHQRQARIFLYDELYRASLDLSEFLAPDPGMPGMVRLQPFAPEHLVQHPSLAEAEQEAHALQSAAGTFGAAALREAGTALERAAVAGDAAGVAAVVGDLPRLVERTLHALSRAAAVPADGSE